MGYSNDACIHLRPLVQLGLSYADVLLRKLRRFPLVPGNDLGRRLFKHQLFLNDHNLFPLNWNFFL
jgi:hypothetical protein